MKKDLIKGFYLKFIEHISLIIFPIVYKSYVRLITAQGLNQPTYELVKAVFLIIAMVLVTFLRPVIGLHFSRAVGTAKTSSNQILRGLFFKKLIRANYRFTFLADESLVSKIFFCDIDSIACFIGSIPNLFAAPIAITVYVLMIGYNISIGWDVLMILGVFLAAAVLVLILSYLIVKTRRDMNYTASVRTMILSEIIPNMVKIKLQSLENFFKNKMDVNRVEELIETKRLHLL